MNKNRTLLCYGLSKGEIDFLSMTRFNCINIMDSMAHSKIKDILDGHVINKDDSKISNEKVILINGYGSDEIPDVVKLIRSVIGDSPILAVVTDTSKEWTFKYLLSHLIQERNWHRNNMKK